VIVRSVIVRSVIVRSVIVRAAVVRAAAVRAVIKTGVTYSDVRIREPEGEPLFPPILLCVFVNTLLSG
jgi:hypothetical protein